MFKLKNFQQIKTTILAIVGGVLVVAGIVWPEKVTASDSETIKIALDQILISIGSLITTFSLMFGAKDG